MPLNSKVLMPAALGLSLLGVTAFVVYYIFIKDEDEVNSKKQVKSSKINVIEVNVPKSIVPALIGRSGSNIKEIEKKTGVLINFKKFSDKDYDVCIIRGRSLATQLAETLVHQFIKEQPVIEEDTLTVPNWACGKIIGKAGQNINEISHCSGARIRLEGVNYGNSNSDRQISFKGTKEQISTAKRLIEDCVALERCHREMDQSKRSPRPSQLSTSSDKPEPVPGESTGASIEVFVSAVSSPSRFWVQLAGAQVAQLDQLVDTMTEFYGSKPNRDAHQLSSVSRGQVVAAVFRHDGRWYRARVVDIRPNEFDATQQVLDVFYLDYGDSEYVAMNEVCELRADLLRLRFQALECFLAGVKPAGREEDTVSVTATGQKWDKWNPQAIERFEQLTQVARWKSLVSRTCTYKKSATGDDEKEKEIPGIKLYDVTEEGELDIGLVLIKEGWAEAVAAPVRSPRPNKEPFGDLGHSKVLGVMVGEGGSARSSSVPKDHKDEPGVERTTATSDKDDGMTSPESVSAGLEYSDKPKSISNFDLSYPVFNQTSANINGSHEDFMNAERTHASTDLGLNAPIHVKTPTDVFKANMNRIDSHHGSLESMGRTHDVHK